MSDKAQVAGFLFSLALIYLMLGFFFNFILAFAIVVIVPILGFGTGAIVASFTAKKTLPRK